MIAFLHPVTPIMTFLEDILIYFLKIKQESSGWPAYIQTEEEAFQYISNYAVRENVKLNSEAITKNPAMRSIAKLLLNSF